MNQHLHAWRMDCPSVLRNPKEGNMANINRTQENQEFQQIEGDNWRSIYLPAICAGILMSIVLFVAVACSKKENQASSGISAPPPAVTGPAPSTTAAVVPEAPKKMKKHRPANATYVNGTYGVSFSYPRKYSLTASNRNATAPLQTGFLKPGAAQIATVDMPDSSYPDTDFSAGLVNVSVNPALTAEECTQFAPIVEGKNGRKPVTIKLGGNEFTTFEQMSGEMSRQADLKYFHLFKNGACYEFALDVETSRKSDEDLAQVDRGQVFKQLQKIVTSARIKEVELPGIEKPVESATLPDSMDGEKMMAASEAKGAASEKAQVVTPEQK
jgi:hypothetical protein